MYRLFVAVDLTESAKEAVVGICRDVAGVRWIDPAQLHLTLRFIGDADEELFAGIKRKLAAVGGPRFQLIPRGVGTFPPRRDPKVLWVGVDRSEAVLGLHREVEQALAGVGLEPEQRAFSPHITLARLRGMPLAKLAPFLERNRMFQAPPVPVSEFHLYSSTLTPKGAIHRREASYSLA